MPEDTDQIMVPREELMREFLESTDDSSVVMVNLMKVRDQDELDRYSRMVLPLVTKHGGTYIYGGPVHGDVTGQSDWEFVAIVRYPSRRAFAEMILSDDYALASPHRIAGLERAEILVTADY
jgi:uncharacterized protein (DUF1330 family)